MKRIKRSKTRLNRKEAEPELSSSCSISEVKTPNDKNILRERNERKQTEGKREFKSTTKRDGTGALCFLLRCIHSVCVCSSQTAFYHDECVTQSVEASVNS